LETAYENWCKNHKIPNAEIPLQIRIVDPIFGKPISREKIRAGKISLTELFSQPEKRKQLGNQVRKKRGNRNNECTLEGFAAVTEYVEVKV